MVDLRGKVAVVTGGSRGIGKGVAEGLGEAGCTVYITGRSSSQAEPPAPLTVEATARAVDRFGGVGIPLVVDHNNDDEVKALFKQVEAEQGHLDILVNNVYQIPDPPATGKGFWEHPISVWDEQCGVGLRGYYTASVFAAPLLLKGMLQMAGLKVRGLKVRGLEERGLEERGLEERGLEERGLEERGLKVRGLKVRGLIVNISSRGGREYVFSASYGVGKAGVDRMAQDFAVELKDHRVAALSLSPSKVKTEFILSMVEQGKMTLDPALAQSVRFTGRTIAALAADPDIMARSGGVYTVSEVAAACGVVDPDRE